ncbi:MAG: nucleoside transporter C-terminal domain-containing protein [Gammaproteobacteria bacterium]|nr:nucleoside transporter C-terminal domain-containing protein [Gammaproteobacteria bacterium]
MHSPPARQNGLAAVSEHHCDDHRGRRARLPAQRGARHCIPVGGDPLTLERLLGWLMSPLALLVGIPFDEALIAGELLGTRVVLTELIAYIRLGELDPALLTERSRIIVTYALCGFANLVGLGIMISGLVTMVPSRRDEILALGFRSLVGGTIATSTTAAIVGILI